MKKLYELKKNELKNLYQNNEEFASEVFEYAYGDAMTAQGDEFDLLGAQAFEWHDHYSSFYLTTPKVYGGKAPEKIAGALDADYMTPENAELYKIVCDKIDEWENMTYDEQQTEQGEKVYDDASDACDKLADGLTEQLRAYEEITDEQLDAVLDAIIDRACYMDEWETDGAKVFEHITKIYQ